MKIRVKRGLGFEDQIVEVDSFDVRNGDLFLFKGNDPWPKASAIFGSGFWEAVWEIVEDSEQ